MIKLALTGSIGMGKSTVARMFEQAGIPVFDADAEVRRLQGESGDLVGAIGRRFPDTVQDGRLDRERLAKIVLEDPRQLAALEAIIHPAVHAASKRFAAAHVDAPAILFEIPLLFETGGEAAYDKVIVVSAPSDLQRERVLARPGMSPARFAAIFGRQMPDAEKRARADFIVDTGTYISTTEGQVREIFDCLRLSPGGYIRPCGKSSSIPKRPV
jgi:dephospho-CoA kinase